MPAVPSNGQRIPFRLDQDLVDSYLVGLQAFDVEGVATAPSGEPVVASLLGLAVTIANNDKQNQKIQQYPCQDLNPAFTNGEIRRFFPIDLNWEKNSFVTILDSGTFSAGEAVVFNVMYVRKAEFEEYKAQYRFYAGLS